MQARCSFTSFGGAAVGGSGRTCRSCCNAAFQTHRQRHVAPTLHAPLKTCLQPPHSRWQRCSLRAVAEALSEPSSADTEGPSVDELKAQFLDSLFGTERGLRVSSELRGELSELITQLEAANPNPAANQQAELLDGEWKLVYTSNSELMALLALAKLPFVKVGDIVQVVDGRSLTVTNRVALSSVFTRTNFSTSASFEVRSPKLLNIRFERGTLQTPELLEDVEFPASINLLGQQIDLTNLRDALQPVNANIRSAVEQISRVVSRAPDLNFPIPSQQAQTWLLTTFLDSGMRIARGDGGSVFVLTKEPQVDPYPSYPYADNVTTDLVVVEEPTTDLVALEDAEPLPVVPVDPVVVPTENVIPPDGTAI